MKRIDRKRKWEFQRKWSLSYIFCFFVSKGFLAYFELFLSHAFGMSLTEGNYKKVHLFWTRLATNQPKFLHRNLPFHQGIHYYESNIIADSGQLNGLSLLAFTIFFHYYVFFSIITCTFAVEVEKGIHQQDQDLKVFTVC